MMFLEIVVITPSIAEMEVKESSEQNYTNIKLNKQNKNDFRA